MLVFAAAALPLGLSLPMVLGAEGLGAPLRRVVLPVLLLAASLTGFYLQPASDRLLAAGLGWNPEAFFFRQPTATDSEARSALPEILEEKTTNVSNHILS